MIPLALIARPFATIPVADVTAWLVQFGTRIVARRLDVPEIVVHGIGLYIAAYISEVERRATIVCPIRVFHELRRSQAALRAATPQSLTRT